MSDSRILEKIRKLVKFAKDGSATEAEVENYMRVAKKLMEENNIAEHQVLADEKNLDARQAAYDSIKEHWSGYEQTGAIQIFDKTLLNVVCDICEVRCFFRHTRDSKRKPGVYLSNKRFESVYFYGMPTDCAVATEFFKELRVAVRTLARMHFGSKWKRQHFDYARGFASRLMERAASFRQSMNPPANCTAIVLAKDAIIARWESANLHFTAGKHSKTRTKDWSAFSRGQSDAEGFDLGVEDRLTASKGGGK